MNLSYIACCVGRLENEFQQCELNFQKLDIDNIMVASDENKIYVVFKRSDLLKTFECFLRNPKFKNFKCAPIVYQPNVFSHSVTFFESQLIEPGCQVEPELVLSTVSNIRTAYDQLTPEDRETLNRACIILSSQRFCGGDQGLCENCKIVKALL